MSLIFRICVLHTWKHEEKLAIAGNAIPAGHVQYPLSDFDEILCR